MPKKRAARRIKNLTAKKLTQKQAKNVRGGIGLLVPAVQKVREAAINTGALACDGSSKESA